MGSAAVEAGHGVSIRLRGAASAAYLLMLVPVCIWLLGWMHWYVSLPCTAAIIAGFAWIVRADYLARPEHMELPVGRLVAIVCICGAWAAFSGTCGIGYGGYDVPWRTAILHDLVVFPWPVRYSTGFAMDYYICFWMLPALIGKLFGWSAALVCLWAYETSVLLVSWMLLALLVGSAKKARDRKKMPDEGKIQWMALAFLLLWCGLNLLGAGIASAFGTYSFELGYNANYSGRFYFRCNIDCIEESYNQIIVWLAVPLFLGNRKMHSYIYLAALLAAFSPWSIIGIAPIMIVAGVIELRSWSHGDLAARPAPRGKEAASSGRRGTRGAVLLRTLREVFSVPNIVGVIGCAVPLLAFYLAASHISGGSSGSGFGVWDMVNVPYYIWLGYFVFEFCQLGVFMLFLTKANRHDPLFWAVVVSLAVIPFFWVGDGVGRDFCMDASLPALCMLMAYAMSYVRDECLQPTRSKMAVAFYVVLALCFAAPVLQLAGQARELVAAGSISAQRQMTDVTTYEGLALEDCDNFVAAQPQDSFFFEYLAR